MSNHCVYVTCEKCGEMYCPRCEDHTCTIDDVDEDESWPSCFVFPDDLERIKPTIAQMTIFEKR